MKPQKNLRGKIQGRNLWQLGGGVRITIGIIVIAIKIGALAFAVYALAVGYAHIDISRTGRIHLERN